MHFSIKKIQLLKFLTATKISLFPLKFHSSKHYLTRLHLHFFPQSVTWPWIFQFPLWFLIQIQFIPLKYSSSLYSWIHFHFLVQQTSTTICHNYNSIFPLIHRNMDLTKTKVVFVCFFYLILNRILMLNSVKY